MAELKIPILLFYSRGDMVVPYRHGDLLKEKASRNPNARVIVSDYLRHGEFGADYQERILEFFEDL